MELIQQYAKELVAILVPFISWALNRAQHGEARLVRGVRHAHSFLVEQPLIGPDGAQIAPTQIAHTASVVSRNVGRKSATNIELVFNFKPMCINFWPIRTKGEVVQPDGRVAYVFNSLARDELLGFELLSVNHDLPQLVNVRCDQGAAKEVRLIQNQQLANWKIMALQGFALLGMAAAAYLVLLLIQFLVLKTPAVLG